MKKIINKKTYNTDTASLEGHITFGSFGESVGYEEKLFKTRTGNYFLYVAGGADSKYPEENIIPFTAAQAKAWIKENV